MNQRALFKDESRLTGRQPKTDRLILGRYLKQAADDLRLDESAIAAAHAILVRWADLESSGRPISCSTASNATMPSTSSPRSAAFTSAAECWPEGRARRNSFWRSMTSWFGGAEIDRLVYELYGLSEEEIAIVEAATG